MTQREADDALVAIDAAMQRTKLFDQVRLTIEQRCKDLKIRPPDMIVVGDALVAYGLFSLCRHEQTFRVNLFDHLYEREDIVDIINYLIDFLRHRAHLPDFPEETQVNM